MSHTTPFSTGMVDVIFADVAQPDQSRIVALNAHNFLKNGGHFVISIKANCVDSTAAPEAVFASEVKKMQQENMKPQEQLTLEPYERDHAVVVGIYSKKPSQTKHQDYHWEFGYYFELATWRNRPLPKQKK
uniref:Uncharacterized protein n=1 Tax=Sphaerodactylus townsendi TaxID=933632 RepID=A0ACB8FS59_9SAUR